jgi:DNA-binding CsgD family transcriptional regulator
MIPQGTLGRIRARRAQPGAWDQLDAAAAAADGTQEPASVVPARLSRAEAHWLAGNTAAAHREAVLAAAAAAAAASPWLRGESAAWLRRTAMSSGPAEAVPVEIAAPYRLGLAGDWRGAARIHADRGCRYDAALALFDSGEESGLRQALDVFTELGATAAVKLTRLTLRRLGVRSIPVGPRAATRADELGLTRREHEVLDLLSEGLTNLEIAARLYISAKTVNHHVSAVLAKLGVSTRAQAAARRASPV